MLEKEAGNLERVYDLVAGLQTANFASCFVKIFAIGARLWLQILPCLKQNLLAFAAALNHRLTLMFFLLLPQNVHQGIHGIQYGFFVGGSAFFGYVVVAWNNQPDFTKLVEVAVPVFKKRHVGADNLVIQVKQFAYFFIDVVLQVFAGFEVYTLDVDAHLD